MLSEVLGSVTSFLPAIFNSYGSVLIICSHANHNISASHENISYYSRARVGLGRTRLGTADHRRHMPSWLSARLGVEASALMEQEWSHPCLLNPFDFSRGHQEQLQNLAGA